MVKWSLVKWSSSPSSDGSWSLITDHCLLAIRAISSRMLAQWVPCQ
jgi:hypothetical protein